MIQVSWWGQMSTTLPTTDSEVARWAAATQPEILRAQDVAGVAYRPSAVQVLVFMNTQARFAQMLRFLYAQDHGLIPATAGAPLPVLAA